MNKENREIASIIQKYTQQILAVEYKGQNVVLTDAYTGIERATLPTSFLETIVQGDVYSVFCYKDELNSDGEWAK